MNELWDDVIKSAVDFRRQLHQHPELTWQEKQTAVRVRSALDKLGIPWRPCAGTGTVARLAPDAPGRHVALRGDMDAIAVHEATGLPWASEVPGTMHACGHDGHMATLMATAMWLKQHEGELPGPVTLLFQPAEEGGHGALEMISDGALEGVEAIYGWHNWPLIPFGQAVCPDGVVMCGNGTFDILVRGRGGHASQPEVCRDPVLAAAAITMALQQVVSRRLQPQHSAVLSVTSIDAPSMRTVIPSEARIGGSIRVQNMADRDRMFEWIRTIAKATAESYGVAADVDIKNRYGPVVNHPGEAERFRGELAAELGAGWHSDVAVPLMASEDFSYYLERIPGAFAIIGADDGQGHDASCHSPHYDFNDRLIPVVLRLFARLAGAPVPPRPEGTRDPMPAPR